jgi:hypothetical protein
VNELNWNRNKRKNKLEEKYKKEKMENLAFYSKDILLLNQIFFFVKFSLKKHFENWIYPYEKLTEKSWNGQKRDFEKKK